MKRVSVSAKITSNERYKEMPKKGYIDINGKEVSKRDVKAHMLTISQITDPNVQEVLNTAFATPRQITVEELNTLMQIIEEENSPAIGSGMKKQAWRHAFRNSQNDNLEMDNYLLVISHDGIDQMTEAEMRLFLHEDKYRKDIMTDIARQYAVPIKMDTNINYEVSDGSKVNRQKPVNSQRLWTPAQFGWEDAAKVAEDNRRDQLSSRAGVVGMQSEITVVESNGEPSSLPDEYGSGRLAPDSSKRGYAVLWEPKIWDGKTSNYLKDLKGEKEDKVEEIQPKDNSVRIAELETFITSGKDQNGSKIGKNRLEKFQEELEALKQN